MEKLTVLQLGSPAGLYGAERWILALIKYLNSEKVHTIVGVIKDNSGDNAPLCKEAQLRGFDTCEIEAYGRFNFSAVRKLRKFLVDNEVDILHTHFYKTDLLGLLAVRGTKCKLISTPHGWSTKADFKLQCYELLDRCLFPFMDAVVPLSEDLFRPLRKSKVYRAVNRLTHRSFLSINRKHGTNQKIKQLTDQQTNLHLITNGVDLSEIEKCDITTAELALLHNDGHYIIGYIGQLIPRKGLNVLFKSLSVLDKDLPWHLVLVGDGEQRSELECFADECKISDRVTFFGYRDNRIEFLNGFDLFVLPSRLEGIPRCLMEAMAAQKLILASDIPGCNDLINDNENGLLFNVDDVDNLTEQLGRIIRHPERFAGLAIAGNEYVNAHYSAASMAGKYQELYDSLIKARFNQR